MKKKGLSRLSIVLMVLCIFFILGCNRMDPDSRREQEIYKGTEGLEMRFLPNSPPSRVYDTSEINIMSELKNKGTYDISGNNCYIHLSGYDDTIIQGLDDEKYCGTDLFGKSRVYPEGGSDTIEFSTDRIRLPTGVDSLSQKFIFTSCYDYETIASPVVCIDPNQYSISSVKEACTVRDVSMSGGQGAPVEVSRVEVDMIGKDKVGFRIHVSNAASGTVIRKGVSLSSRGGKSCPYNLEYDDYNVIDYDVQMSGGSLESCTPDQPRLINGQGQIFCKFRIRGDQPYTTPLQVRLRYSYMDSMSKTVDILKTPE